MIFIAMSAFGQKKVLVVDDFTYASNVGQNYTLTLRNNVIEGITATQKLQVVDITTDQALMSEVGRRQSESAMSADNAKLEAVKTLGADFILQGHLTSITTTRKVASNGNVSYTSKAMFQLKVINVADGTIRLTKNYDVQSSFLSTHTTEGDAIGESLKFASGKMEDMVDEAFPIEGKIIEIAESKDNKAKKVYVNIGSDAGLSKGQKFDVYVDRTVAGRVASKKIGELKAEAVEAGDLTFCKVTKGDEDIYKYVNEGANVTVKTKVDTSLF